MLFATNYLSRHKYLTYKKKGVNIFLFNEIDFPVEEYSGDVFLNCNSEKVPSTWYTWNENDKLLQSFKLKYPAFFDWKGYDMTLVFQKMLFWSSYKTGFLWYCKEKFYPDEEVCHIDPMYPYSIAKCSMRYLKMLLERNKIGMVTVDKITPGKEIGIHLKDEFELGLYDSFIDEAVKTGEYNLFYDKNVSKDKLANLGFDKKDIRILSTYERVSNFPLTGLKELRGADWFVMSMLLRHWDLINKWMYRAEQIAATGIRKLLVNEAENGIYGACIGVVMKKHGIKVYNTMNGLKAGQSQDAHVNFTKWFVWDEQMKNMLVEKCGLDKNMLLVSGHLMEDYARNYVYQHSLQIDEARLKGKKIISVFSIKTKRQIKYNTLNYLYNLVRRDESYFLIVRPHPIEKPEDYILPDFKSDRILWVNYSNKNSRTTLYDQILVADLCVVFGSTVALECKWFGKPCITFEIREKSILYFADGKDVVHVNQMEEFERAIDRMSATDHNRTVRAAAQTVASRMVDFIKND